jgi:hypothetical protein
MVLRGGGDGRGYRNMCEIPGGRSLFYVTDLCHTRGRGRCPLAARVLNYGPFRAGALKANATGEVRGRI